MAISKVLLFVLSVATVASSTDTGNCRCVPDQWGGILASLDREFDLEGGRSGTMENKLYVYYDFGNKRFAMEDLKTGNRAIADYAKGFKYVIRNGLCRGLHTMETMRQMCLPESAEYLGKFDVGTNIPVEMWSFAGPYNVSMKTTVMQKNCVPISEEVYLSRSNYASLTTSVYLDVKVGLADLSVFDPPKDCLVDERRSRLINRIMNQKRRSRTLEPHSISLYGLLQNGMPVDFH